MGSSFFPSLQGIEWPVTKTPMWKTLTQTSESGVDYTISLWTFPRYKWQVSFSFLNLSDMQTLGGFYNSVYGAGDTFLFDDVNDDSITNQTIGVGNGSTTVFQACRAWGGFVEPVFYIKTSPAPIVYRNGSVITTGFTITNIGGYVTFTTPPTTGDVISMTFGYAWPVRFMADSYDFDQFVSQLWENKKLDFISQKRYP